VRVFRLLFYMCLSLLAAGCDLTGQYEANFQKALQTSGQRAKFDGGLNSEYEEIVDGEGKPIGVKLRLPKVFDNSKQKKPLVDERVMAAIAAKMPNAPNLGSNMGYRLERALDDDKGQFQPVTILIQTIPRRGGTSDASREAMTKMLSTMKWTDAEVPTPEGKTLTLKRRRMAAEELPAVGKAAGQIGLMDMYMVEGPAHNVMISWIAPKGQTDKYQLEQTSEAAMGTVQVEGVTDSGGGTGKATPGCF
jgi:hypothetical protein